jgi:hypothetical protein
VKKIAGEEMTGEKLYSHMQFYLKLFQSSKYPTAKSIYESTVAKFLQDLVSNNAALYKELMVNGTSTVETYSDLNILHLNSKNKAIGFYDKEKKIGDNNAIIFHRNALINEMEKIQNEQNGAMFLRIESRMKDRELEAQRNETLYMLRKVEDLRKSLVHTELKVSEAMKATQKCFRDEQSKYDEIVALQKLLRLERNEMMEAMRRHTQQVNNLQMQHAQQIRDVSNMCLYRRSY